MKLYTSQLYKNSRLSQLLGICLFFVVYTFGIVYSIFLRNNTNISDKENEFNCEISISTTGSNILLNTSSFKQLRLCGAVFVDKSEMINEYLERGGVVLMITRPFKWGKSVNIDMFKVFFEIEVDKLGNEISEGDKVNRLLFVGGNVTRGCGTTKILQPLRVSKYPSAMDHQGTNPVILLSLKDINGDSFDEFEKSIKQTIVSLYLQFPYLRKRIGNKTHFIQDDDKIEERLFDLIKLQNSLLFLSKILFKHFKKNVYIFVDDFDTPIKNAYIAFGAKSGHFENILKMIYDILGRALKDNWFLERAVLMGTYHFGWINEIFKLHDVRHSTIVDMTFSSYFGFTSDEISDILNTVKTNVNPVQLKNWYNGYDFDRVLTYNPWSVLSCLSNGGKFDYYWGKLIQASRSLFDEVYLMDGPQEYLQQLLQDKLVIRKEINKPINLINIEDTFHRVFLFGGLFKSVPGFCEYNCYIHPWNLSIPNLEIRNVIAGGVSKWVMSKLNITDKEYRKLATYFTDLQIDKFSAVLQNYLTRIKLLKSQTEQNMFNYQLIGGLISSFATDYKIKSIRKAGQKYREYILTSLPNMGRDVIIVQYEVGKAPRKVASAVEIGMKKLICKDYSSKMTVPHNKTLVKVYMILCKNKLSLKYSISEVG